jgi:uncharacterized protein
MDVLYWSLIIALFIVAFVGLIYPIIPSLVFVVGGFLLYGIFYSFEPFTWFFWAIQIMFILLLFSADYMANMIGVKKYGGTKAGIWGSTIGLLVGPFIIPIFGIIIGPFLGAVIAELVIHRKGVVEAMKIGVGSVLGFVGSVIAKAIIQIFMIIYFLFYVL